MFGVVSWFGGIALIRTTVESEISRMLEPGRQAAARPEVLAKQFTGQVEEISKNAAKADAAVKETNEKVVAVREDEKKLADQLSAFRSAAESAMDGINGRMESLRKTINQLEEQGAKPEILAKLYEPVVTVRLPGGVSAEFAAQLSAKKMSEGGKYAVTIEGGRSFVGNSSLRFFYQQNEATAKEIARITGEALGQLGVQDASLPLVNLSGLPIKPPERSFEVWLNVAGGRLR